VQALEIFPQLAESARANLAGFGVRGAQVIDADGLRFESATRFDVVAVTASLPIYDARFERLLNVGGRLFIVVGEPPVMEARLVERTAEGAWSTQSVFETVIDPMVNAVRPAEFTF
jgi:protein-L-isoaspartate(D-aspartate) O-methyltransferase